MAKTLIDSSQRLLSPLLLASCLLLAGCSTVAGENWHSKKGWKAEDYFTDAQVIALCKAIEADDVDEIERLVKAGADVNAKGKGNMTPLLWAFAGSKTSTFEKLLVSGADPNVVVESKFNTPLAIHAGSSVTHLAAAARSPDYFFLVMDHGGDPHLIDLHDGYSLLHAVIDSPGSDRRKRIQRLIDAKIDLDGTDHQGNTAAILAVATGGQYGIARMLLEAGANPKAHGEKNIQRLVHVIDSYREEASRMTGQGKADFDTIVKILEDAGESFETARKDRERWMERGKVNTPAKAKELREKEVAEYIAREKAEAEQKQPAEKP